MSEILGLFIDIIQGLMALIIFIATLGMLISGELTFFEGAVIILLYIIATRRQYE